MWKELKAALLLALIPAVSGLVNCTLDDATPPPLAGPSELALAIELRAIPDQLTADGFSSSVIEAIVRNDSGNRVGAGAVTVIFDIARPGTALIPTATFFDLGNIAPLDSPRPIAGGEEARTVSVPTDGSGVARARYWAPFRTDQENDTVVTVTARPAGTDVRGALLRQVDIFLRAANRPSFPGRSVCDFMIEPLQTAWNVGQQVFFTATQITGANGRPIARYEWEFDDPTVPVAARHREGRNVDYVWSAPDGNAVVALFTTESITGFQTNCTKSLNIVP